MAREVARKICVMTGTRAEYGLMYWLMRELEANIGVELQLIVSAMHLSSEFGQSIKLIKEDGFRIDAEVPCLADGDDFIALGKSIGIAHLGFVDALARLKPSLLVLLGDRFETFAAASAATALRIPIVHIHGGETSEGAMDEVFRHAVTKMAHIHLVAAPQYRQRVIQMGEVPARVHVVGALGLENFERLELPGIAELSASLDFDLSGQYVLMTYHAATLEDRSPVAALDEVLAALDAVPNVKVLATMANADPGGRAINARLESYAGTAPGRVRLVKNLGQKRYLAAMLGAAAVVGNSSSGLIEAPAVNVPTVNIGSRQDGRLKALSVIDCAEHRDGILAALRQALNSKFKRALAQHVPPYGRPASMARHIVTLLKDIELDGLLKKTFYDFKPGALI